MVALYCRTRYRRIVSCRRVVILPFAIACQLPHHFQLFHVTPAGLRRAPRFRFLDFASVRFSELLCSLFSDRAASIPPCILSFCFHPPASFFWIYLLLASLVSCLPRLPTFDFRTRPFSSLFRPPSPPSLPLPSFLGLSWSVGHPSVLSPLSFFLTAVVHRKERTNKKSEQWITTATMLSCTISSSRHRAMRGSAPRRITLAPVLRCVLIMVRFLFLCILVSAWQRFWPFNELDLGFTLTLTKTSSQTNFHPPFILFISRVRLRRLFFAFSLLLEAIPSTP